MEFQFEKGSADRPRGHALVYFRSSARPDSVLATYVVVLPIAVDLAKYLPPMLAAGLPATGAGGPPAVPWPPIPEPVESQEYLSRLAATRDDDLIWAGAADPSRLDRLMELTGEAVQQYAELCLRRAPGPVEPPPAEAGSELDVDEVLYGLMGEHGRLTELVKLTGKLRDAVQMEDSGRISDALADLRKLARHFPAKYQLDGLLAAASQPGDRASRLAELHVDRCYRVLNEDYVGLRQVDDRIRELSRGA